MASIHFFSEDIDFVPEHKMHIRTWLKAAAAAEGYSLGELNLIFCSDEYLLGINQEFLNHDTYTDIITFDHSEESGLIIGDIFVSVERVQDNAQTYQVSVTDELHRVIIHGLLHLVGYGDSSPADKAQMTAKENHYLALRPF